MERTPPLWASRRPVRAPGWAHASEVESKCKQTATRLWMTEHSHSFLWLTFCTRGCTLSSLLPSTLQGEAAERDRSCHLVPRALTPVHNAAAAKASPVKLSASMMLLQQLTARVQADLYLQKLAGRGHQCVIPCRRQARGNVRTFWLPLPIVKRDIDRNAAPAQKHPCKTEKLGWWDAANSSPHCSSPGPPWPPHCPSKLLQSSKAEGARDHHRSCYNSSQRSFMKQESS